MNLVRHPAAACLLALALPCLSQSTAPAQQDETQPPAPIVRPVPKPIILKPPAPSDGQNLPPSSTPVVKPKPKPAVPSALSSTGEAPPVPKTAPSPKPATTAKLSSTPAVTIKAATSTGPMFANDLLPPGPFNPTVVLIDPAHGGTDTGSRISDAILEKDVTLALAFKLRSLLAARGFTVDLTRDTDAAIAPNSPNPLTLDDRAGLANHAHPVARLLLHATAAGNGVHLYSSELESIPAEPFGTPWLTAQAAWVSQSQRLQKQLGAALIRANIPLVASRASVRPVDSLTCPALVIELAPNGGDVSTLNDADYQQRIAQAIATALIFWQNQAQPPPRVAPPVPAPPAIAVTPSPSSTGAQP